MVLAFDELAIVPQAFDGIHRVVGDVSGTTKSPAT
jgi:hypothetical protein